MTEAVNLSPERFLEQRRIAHLLAAPDGQRVAQTSSVWSSSSAQATLSVHVWDRSKRDAGLQEVLSGAALDTRKDGPSLASSEVAWLDSSTLLYQSSPRECWARPVGGGAAYKVGSLPVDVANISIYAHNGDNALLCFSAAVYREEPDLARVETLAKQYKEAANGSTGILYSKLWVRNYDRWIDSTETQLFAVRLKLTNGKWGFRGDYIAPLAHSGLQCPEAPFGSVDDYVVTPDGRFLIFIAKHATLPKAWHTCSPVHLVELQARDATIKTISDGQHGLTSSLSISSDGKLIAWLQMARDGYEKDPKRVVIYSLAERKHVTHDLVGGEWHAELASIKFSPDRSSLIILALDRGHTKLFSVDLQSNVSATPRALTREHTVSSFAFLVDDTLVLAKSSFAEPPETFILEDGRLQRISKSAAMGIGLSEAEEFWFDGDKQPIHGFIHRPPGFEKGKKYPMIYAVHGGPHSAWKSVWIEWWQWSSSLWASQGYIVVCPNPTGSPGYGTAFNDAVSGDWSGSVIRDLVAGLRHVVKSYPEIDTDRMAVCGGSFGGYIMNWIASHNQQEQLGFKAIINYVGVFDTNNYWYHRTDLYDAEHEFGGLPWESDKYESCNPAQHVAKWNTPTFVVAGERDFLVPITESLATFNVLQRKGIPSQLMVFPDESHVFVNPANVAQWIKAALAFTEEWVPGGPR